MVARQLHVNAIISTTLISLVMSCILFSSSLARHQLRNASTFLFTGLYVVFRHILHLSLVPYLIWNGPGKVRIFSFSSYRLVV